VVTGTPAWAPRLAVAGTLALVLLELLWELALAPIAPHGSWLALKALPLAALAPGVARGQRRARQWLALLLPFYGVKNYGELSRTGLMRSDDRGESWYYFSEMAYDPRNEKNYLEPGLYRTESGRLVGLYRTQSDFYKPGVDFEDTYLNLHMSVSVDNGKTFGPVYEANTLWGSSPFHALRLKSGKELVSYGYRRPPFGIRARLCNSELTDINEVPEIILRDDAPNGDLGYPNSLQLPDGTAMVSYYISGSDGIRKIEATLLRE
jgi:hypothetical protein